MSTTRFLLPAAFVVLLLASSPVPAAPLEAMPFEQVRAGMKGTGRTVFSGTRIETFDVEIVGTLPNIGPDQNLILARCSGGPLAQTGVLAGMSGSPVFVEGRLVGAVAYSWGFSKDALAGITPIGEMIAVSQRKTPRARAAAASWTVPGGLERLRRPELLAGFFEGQVRALAGGGGALQATIPLSVGGLGPRGFASVAPTLASSGFVPVQGGGAGRRPEASPALEPGSAVGVKLVRGDVDMTATGTVTWVDGTRVLAFGHPLFGLGAVDLPLTGARVEALLPSLQQSMRIATPLSELGTLEQDRASAIVGRLGGGPRMIPVRLRLVNAQGESREYSFDVADDPLLAPLLLYASLNGILTNHERTVGSVSLRLGRGSVVQIEGQGEVAVDNMFTGPTAPVYATGMSAYVLYLLMNNDWATPRISGVNLLLEYDELPRTAAIRRVMLDRYRVRAGETVTATILVSPFRGKDETLTRQIVIPPDTEPGRLTVHVGNAEAIEETESIDGMVAPRTLPQLVGLINHVRRNDRIYVVALSEDSGVALAGERLPNLPPSVAGVLSRPRSLGNHASLGLRGVFEEQIETAYAVNGVARVSLEVERP